MKALNALNKQELYQLFFAENPSAIQEITEEYFTRHGYRIKIDIRTLLDSRVTWWLRNEVYSGRLGFDRETEDYFELEKGGLQ